jgi:hypothetical protein
MSRVATLLERIQPMYAGRFDKNELRRSQLGVLETFVVDTANANGILTEDIKRNIMSSFGRKGGVVIPALNADTVTIGNTRSCVVSFDENTSAEFVLTFQTYAWSFTMIPSSYAQNAVKYREDFSRKMNKYLVQLYKDIEAQCVTTLEADKNQLYPADVTAIYPELADALRVSSTDAPDAYNNIETISNLQDFEGGFNVMASTGHKPLISRLTNQGQSNGINEAFQFGPFSYGYSNRITNGAGVRSTAYVVPEGNLAIMNRNDIDSIMGSKSSNGKEWKEVELPMAVPMSGSPRMKVGSLYYSDCANAITELGSALGGQSEASLKEAYLFSTDVVTLTAYNSNRTTIAGPVQKYEFLT